jgi:hypothetical protein
MAQPPETIQLVGGPRDGVSVTDDGRQCLYVPVPIDYPLMDSLLPISDLAPSFRQGIYERQWYVSLDRPAREVLLWKGVR